MHTMKMQDVAQYSTNLAAGQVSVGERLLVPDHASERVWTPQLNPLISITLCSVSIKHERKRLGKACVY